MSHTRTDISSQRRVQRRAPDASGPGNGRGVRTGGDTPSVGLKFLLHLHPPTIPADSAKFTYTFGLGGLALFSFLVTALTGIVLLFFYTPTPEAAHASMEHIRSVLPYGWYFRNLHFWAAQVMVVAVVLHMTRIVLTGGYLRGRRFNWLIGLLLLVFTLIMDFTGFPLRWDAGTHWALVVGTHLVQNFPVMGARLYRLIVGGPEVSGVTLLRFYTWHGFGLPFLAGAFITYHIFRVRKDGGISSRPADVRTPRIRRESLLGKEIVFALIMMSVLSLLAALFAAPLGDPAAQGVQLHDAEAPWIFLGIQFMLRFLPPVVAGFVIPLGFLLFWSLLPVMDTRESEQGRWLARGRKIYWGTFLSSVGILVLATLAEKLLIAW